MSRAENKKLPWPDSSAERPDDDDPSSKRHHPDDAEVLNPHHECPSRRTGLLPATFNLVATIVGGGILSVPLAFEKCGVVLATILMILAAVLTDFSLYILCSCSRRTGARSYGQVCKLSYGPGLEVFTTLLLFVFLLFVIVAYMVLVRDIWTPVATLAFETVGYGQSQSSSLAEKDAIGNGVLLAIVLLMTPFMLKKDLHALRYNCYVGFASITVLCVAIAHRAWEKYHGDPPQVVSVSVRRDDPDPVIALFPDNVADVLFAFPIITLAFLSQFNIVSIHGSLVDPTRRRVRRVIDVAVAMCFALTYAFGLAGYLYAGAETRGNILLNFDLGDKFVLAGRLGCGVTIMLAMPMMALPCRESALALGPQFAAWRAGGGGGVGGGGGREASEEADRGDEDDDDGVVGGGSEADDDANSSDDDSTDEEEGSVPRAAPVELELASSCSEGTPLLRQSKGAGRSEYRRTPDDDPELPAKEEESNGSGAPPRASPPPKQLLEGGPAHYGATFLIASACYVGAVAAPGVAVVWSICGSSMAFLIAFVLPAACYIRVRAGRKGHRNRRILAAWFVLAFAVVGAVACTLQTVWRMFLK